MLSRIVPVTRSLGSVARFQAARCMSSHAPAHWKPDRTIAQEHQCTMDHMPVPAGSWQEQYDKTNGKYNIFLAVAVVFFTVTIYVVNKSGALYLHMNPNMKKRQKQENC